MKVNKTVRWVLVILLAGLLCFFGFIYYTFSSFDFCEGKTYTKADLINNYNSKRQEIEDLKRYINSIVPPNKGVDIEFKDDEELAIFHIVDNGNQNSNWNLDIDDKKTDSLLQILNWKKGTLRALKQYLDKANCISVSNGEPCTIGYQRSCLGKYYYNLFDKSIPNIMKTKYNDSCTHILYNDKLVLEYGGGVVGPQCFPTQ